MTMQNNNAKLATIAIAMIEPLESEGEPWLLGGVVGEGEGMMSVDGQGVRSGGSEGRGGRERERERERNRERGEERCERETGDNKHSL